MHWMCGRPLHCLPNKAHCIRLGNCKEKEGKKGLASSQNTGLWPFVMTVFSNLTVLINLASNLTCACSLHSEFTVKLCLSFQISFPWSYFRLWRWPYTVNSKELSCAAETAVIQYFLLRKKKIEESKATITCFVKLVQCSRSYRCQEIRNDYHLHARVKGEGPAHFEPLILPLD